MRLEVLAIVAAILPAIAWADPPGGVARFDGDWSATVSCPDSNGALGYSFGVPTRIKDGALHGERMHPGEPGWLLLDGQVQPDGQAKLYAKGLVGAAPFAVGQRPKGTGYGYHVVARFEDGRGSGTRVEGRHCDLEFVRH